MLTFVCTAPLGHYGVMSTHPAPEGPRALARRLHVQRILEAAEQQLAEGGPAALSLRAIARDQGMASSAIYRYFASAEDLLTALIMRAYADLGEAAEQAGKRAEDSSADADADADADAGTDSGAGTGTGSACGVSSRETVFLAICHACREWALAQPHRYALIYGSPVPDYRAPQDTVEQASRVGLALLRVLAGPPAAAASAEPQDARTRPEASGEGSSGRPHPAGGREEQTAEARLLAGGFLQLCASHNLSPRRAPAVVAVWTQLFGLINFEVFGHFQNVVSDRRAFFEQTLRSAYRGLEDFGAEQDGLFCVQPKRSR